MGGSIEKERDYLRPIAPLTSAVIIGAVVAATFIYYGPLAK